MYLCVSFMVCMCAYFVFFALDLEILRLDLRLPRAWLYDGCDATPKQNNLRNYAQNMFDISGSMLLYIGENNQSYTYRVEHI